MVASEGKSYWNIRAWMAASDDKIYGKFETELRHPKIKVFEKLEPKCCK
jgi:hypothetical protein